jgi:hypothetical protein
VIDFTKQLEADEAGIGKVSDQIDKLKGNAKKGTPNKALSEDTHAKKLHDSILKTSVATSAVAKNLHITDLLADVGRRKKKNDDGEGGSSWETVPGNVNGIYNAIILPEFRATKDPRLLDYWDMMIRKAQENIYAGMPDFEEKQWSQVKKPSMMWSRAQDLMLIGQRNRGITEMYNLIKAYPQHPDAAGWIAILEGIAAPTAAPQPATIQTSGTVAPPTAIPDATAPGTPPTAVIVPAPAGTR